MMTEKDKGILEGIILAVKGGQFVQVKNYVNSYGEVSDYYVHGSSNYESVHDNSLKELNAMRQNASLSFDVTRNAWFDADGTEHTRKASGRTRKEVKQTVKQGEEPLIEAFDKVEKSITAPKQVESNYEGEKSAYEMDGEIYLRNVLIESKVVRKDGEYPVTCSSLVNSLVDLIKRELPIGKYRAFKLNSTNCESLSASGEIFIFPK